MLHMYLQQLTVKNQSVHVHECIVQDEVSMSIRYNIFMYLFMIL